MNVSFAKQKTRDDGSESVPEVLDSNVSSTSWGTLLKGAPNNSDSLRGILTQQESITIPIETGTFLFVSARDSDRALEHLSIAVLNRAGASSAEASGALTQLYEKFLDQVFARIERLEVDSRRFQVACLPHEALQAALLKRTAGHFTVSLNAGDADWCDFALELSRLRTAFSGNLEMTKRPGAADITTQLRELRRRMKERGAESVCLVDDHAFSCRSIERTVCALQNAGIAVSHIVTQSQVADSPWLDAKGIPVLASCRFVHSDPSETRAVLESLDLVEGRYFLLGANGGVVKLRGGHYGRAPYLVPFVNSTEKASIPTSEEGAFSRDVLKLNGEFFEAVKDRLGVTLRVRDSHPDVARLLEEHGYSANTALADVARQSAEQSEKIKGAWSALSQIQSRLHHLRLPRECLFLDINGTLILPGEPGVPELLEEELMQGVERLQRNGISVGLCSDSPLSALTRLASRWGMKGPILAENGDLVACHDRTASLNAMHSVDLVREAICRIAQRTSHRLLPEMYAVDFGNTVPSLKSGFAFGAGRVNSLSCFADKEFIDVLRKELPTELRMIGGSEQLAFDFNPDCGPYGVAIIHAGGAIDRGKQRAFSTLRDGGVEKLWMIGDGMADLVAGSGMQSLLVGQSASSKLGQEAIRFTHTPGVAGVIEMIDSVIAERLREHK